MKNRMRLAEGNACFYKPVKFRIALLLVPVQPCDLIVLTIRIVIAGLGIAKFITSQKHGRSLTEKQHQHRIFHLFFAKLQHFPFPGRPFCATVPAVIFLRTVFSTLAIGFIVLFIIRNHICQRKTIGSSHIIDHSAIFQI